MTGTADKNLVEAVIGVLDRVLAADEDFGSLDRNSEVLGAIPSFDSQSVVSLLLELENEFGIEVNDDDISAETFATVGSLADFVASKLVR